MITPKFLPVTDTFLNYLLEKATPEEILAFQVSDAEKEYAQELVERKSAGTLTSEEAEDLDRITEFNSLVMVLKAKAIRTIQES